MNGSGRKGSTWLAMVEGLRLEMESYKSIASAKSRSINQKEFRAAAQPGRYKTRCGEKNELQVSADTRSFKGRGEEGLLQVTWRTENSPVQPVRLLHPDLTWGQVLAVDST